MKKAVFIGLGSNIDAEANLKKAANLLRAHWPAIRFSRVYATAAREVEDQDPFLNAAAILETDETPDAVALILREIEQTLGKAPPYRFGPRTIDLDILLYGNKVIDTPNLHIPHPRMHERRFVLEPLCELADKKARHPVLKQSWKNLFAATADQLCERITMRL